MKQLTPKEQLAQVEKIALIIKRGKRAITDKDTRYITNENAQEVLSVIVYGIFRSTAGKDRDTLYKNAGHLITGNNKRIMHQATQQTISLAVSKYMTTESRLPTAFEIARDYDLPKDLVSEVLNTYENSAYYKGRIDTYKAGKEHVIAKIYAEALNGNMGAAKMFLQLTGDLSQQQAAPHTTIVNNTQNNFVQINGVTISQSDIERLTPEQQQLIAGVFKSIAAPATGTEAYTLLPAAAPIKDNK